MKPFVFSIIFVAFTSLASAAIQVSLRLPKTEYLAHESIVGTLSVANRSGQDVLLSGPGRTSWLTFVVEHDGNMVPPPRSLPKSKPYLLKAGETLTEQIVINQFYPMSIATIYTVRANVSVPFFNTFYASEKSKLEVKTGSKIWQQAYGTPDPLTGQTDFRKYTLLRQRGRGGDDLYVQVESTSSSKVLSTFSLGEVMIGTEVAQEIDRNNHLHVLHPGAPRQFIHTVIDENGRVTDQKGYKRGDFNTSKPTLMIDQAGEIRVRGGIPANLDDRNDKVAEDVAKQIRKASERPIGLPGTR